MQVDCTFDAKFFGKNVSFVASKLSARGQFIFCLWSMCTTFSHNLKNITQNGQNHSCDTIALKRRYVLLTAPDGHITSRCPGKALHFSDEDVTSGYDMLELPVSRSLISRQNRSSLKFLPTPFWAESCRAAALRNLSFVIRAVKIIKSEFCNLVSQNHMSHQFP